MRRDIHTKDYILFIEAWCLLALARCFIYLFPFKYIVLILERKPNVNKAHRNVNPFILDEISNAIRRGCSHSFWKTKCFEQALAGKIMLNRRRINSSVYFGVADNGVFMAHAWLECEGRTITGGKGKDKFAVINKF